MTVDRGRVVQTRKKLLLLLLGLLLRGLCLLRFLRHVALQAMSEWRYRYDAHLNDEHRGSITTSIRKEIRIELEHRPRARCISPTLLECRSANPLHALARRSEYSSSLSVFRVNAETRINQGFLRHKNFSDVVMRCILRANFLPHDTRAW